jgi:type II secretory pathway pseudopilin PulG
MWYRDRCSQGIAQGGYSLLELIIVMGLVAMVAVPLTVFTYKGLSSFEFLQAQSNTSQELTTLAARMTKVIRGATGIVSATDNSLIIYGYFSPADTQVKKIRYFINGTNLNIGVTPPTGTAPNYTYNSANEVITVTRVDLQMEGNALFRYYDENGVLLPNGFSLSQVKGVGVYVAANPRTKQLSKPVSLSTQVTLRNFKTNL